MGIIIRNCTDKKKVGGRERRGKKKSPFMFGGEGKCEKDGLHCFITLFVKKNKQQTRYSPNLSNTSIN